MVSVDARVFVWDEPKEGQQQAFVILYPSLTERPNCNGGSKRSANHHHHQHCQLVCLDRGIKFVQAPIISMARCYNNINCKLSQLKQNEVYQVSHHSSHGCSNFSLIV